MFLVEGEEVFKSFTLVVEGKLQSQELGPKLRKMKKT